MAQYVFIRNMDMLYNNIMAGKKVLKNIKANVQFILQVHIIPRRQKHNIVLSFCGDRVTGQNFNII